MNSPRRSLIARVRDLLQSRRERNHRRGRKPTLRFETLEPRWAMIASPTDHIHPTLSIFIDGQQVAIPDLVGLSATLDSNPHTHESSVTAHPNASYRFLTLAGAEVRLQTSTDLLNVIVEKIDFATNSLSATGGFNLATGTQTVRIQFNSNASAVAPTVDALVAAINAAPALQGTLTAERLSGTGTSTIDDASVTASSFVLNNPGRLHIGEGGPAGLGSTIRNVTLKDFFDIWRTTKVGDPSNNPNAVFTSTQILNKTVDATHSLRMYVNGVLNTEYENFIPDDGDDVVIVYGSNPILSLNTNFGPILVEMFGDQTPQTVQNFLMYVNDGRMDDTIFHRGDHGASSGGAPFVIQGGGLQTNSTTFTATTQYTAIPKYPSIANESSTLASLSNIRGTIAMARTSDLNSATSEFFINLSDNLFLNDNASTTAKDGYAVFGRILDMSAVDTIGALAARASIIPAGFAGPTPITSTNVLSVIQSVTGTITIGGTVFVDANNNGVQNSGELGRSQVRVYLDANNNGSFDSNTELSTLTDSSGQYSIITTAGTYKVRAVAPSGTSLSTAAAAGFNSTVSATQTASGVNFALAGIAPPSGVDLLAASDSGTSNTDNITNVTNGLQFTVSGLTSGATVQLKSGATVLVSGTASGTTLTLATTVALAEGSQPITATQTIDGVTSDASPALSVTVDTTAPIALSSTPPTSANVGAPLTYNAQHAEEPAAGIRYSLATPPAGATIDANTGVLQWTPTAAQLGAQSFAVVATDLAGNIRNQAISLTVADVKLIDFHLMLTNLSGQTLTAPLNIGDKFQLRFLTTDLRSNPQGVFAAFADVTFDGTKAVVTSDPIVYGSSYQTAKSGTTTTAGLIDELGATASSLSPLGGDEFLVATVTLQATASGTLLFEANQPDIAPGHNILLYGTNDVVAPTRVTFGSASVVVQSGVTATADTFNVNEDSSATTLNPLANDVKPAGSTGTLVVSQVGTPNHGGTVTITNGGANISYTPAANFVGVETFTYKAQLGSEESEGTITVQVANVNDSPTGVNDTLTAVKGSVNNVLDVLANDTDLDLTQSDALKVTAIGVGSAGGSLSLGPNGTHVVYTPLSTFSGVETFTYTLADKAGVTSTATATVTVTNPNSTAVAVNDTFTVAEDSSQTSFTVLANDLSTASGSPTLTVTAVGSTANATVTIATGGGSVVYTPKANFQGTDTFTYTMSDGAGGSAVATVNVTVTNVNDNPDAVNDTFTALKNSVNQTLTVLANDAFSPDPQETLTVQSVTTGSSGGTLSVASDGKGVVYRPATDFVGTETFSYTLSDGNGGTDTATVSVSVLNFLPSSLSGKMFVDVNNDGTQQTGELPLAGVTVVLTGTETATTQTVNRTLVTGADGSYSFTQLAPGAYKVTQQQPAFMMDGRDMVGSQGGASTTNDEIVVTLSENVVGVNNNFAERGRTTQYLDLREFLSSRARTYATVAVNATTGMVWNTTTGDGWSTVQLTGAQLNSAATQLELTANQTSVSSSMPTAVKATVVLSDATKVAAAGTDGSNRLYRLLGPSSGFNFTAVTTTASGEGESNGSNGSTSGGEGEAAVGGVEFAMANSSSASNSTVGSNGGSSGGSAAGSAARLADIALSQPDEGPTGGLLDFLSSARSSTTLDEAVDQALAGW